ncbi:hypothetical protein [Rhodococcus tukisamuensis]|uniref:Phosphoribosyl transferase domain-containing protein n=1 Tax=Rhodococcus tukisamuensis TaxID=168276 RepID=A0A1G6MNJ3_9NOCA|nr:hypothetical protein [Rhodococcus tukisamuensis]SDC57158.1 hypothetical protein SAMN05444580_101250 [Rhodococcus tukisamuensis]
MPTKFSPEELYPVLPAGDGICGVCFGWSEGAELCGSCRQIRDELESSRIDVRSIKVLPISLAVKGDALAGSLYGYKNNGDPAVRADHAGKVRALLHEYVQAHGRCLGAVAGIGKFDLITWVPSAQGARVGTRHPLAAMIEDAPWNCNRATELLSRTTVGVDYHRVHPKRFEVTGDVAGRSVMVVDDVWTRGANAMSAAWALRDAGAAAVAIVVIGRWHTPDYRDSGIYSETAQEVGFEMDNCVQCDQSPITGSTTTPVTRDLWTAVSQVRATTEIPSTGAAPSMIREDGRVYIDAGLAMDRDASSMAWDWEDDSCSWYHYGADCPALNGASVGQLPIRVARADYAFSPCTYCTEANDGSYWRDAINRMELQRILAMQGAKPLFVSDL